MNLTWGELDETKAKVAEIPQLNSAGRNRSEVTWYELSKTKMNWTEINVGKMEELNQIWAETNWYEHH